jgi:hypothetical protein
MRKGLENREIGLAKRAAERKRGRGAEEPEEEEK